MGYVQDLASKLCQKCGHPVRLKSGGSDHTDNQIDNRTYDFCPHPRLEMPVLLLHA